MNFQEIKKRIPIEETIGMLGLKMEWCAGRQPPQFRGPCPTCGGKNKSALAITPGKGFTCFARMPVASGTVLDLVCHIRGLDPKAQLHTAAKELAEHFQLDAAKAPPQEPTRAQRLAEVADKLDYAHDALEAIGLDEETARAIGWGYKKGGMAHVRGRIAIPMYSGGILIGYAGYCPGMDPPIAFPDKFDLVPDDGKVVPMRKRASG